MTVFTDDLICLSWLIGFTFPRLRDLRPLLAAPLNHDSPPPRCTTWGHLKFPTATIPCRTRTFLVTGKTYFAPCGKLAHINYIIFVSTRARLFSPGDQQLLVVLQSSTNLPASIFTPYLETCDAYDLKSICRRLRRAHSSLLCLRYLG